VDDVGRSQKADKPRKAKRAVRSGYGDQGDEQLGAFEDDCVMVVIETPRVHRISSHSGRATVHLCSKGVVPAGAVFPFDLGFVPGTATRLTYSS
jgi:hypothetical protein